MAIANSFRMPIKQSLFEFENLVLSRSAQTVMHYACERSCFTTICQKLWGKSGYSHQR